MLQNYQIKRLKYFKEYRFNKKFYNLKIILICFYLVDCKNTLKTIILNTNGKISTNMLIHVFVRVQFYNKYVIITLLNNINRA